MKTLYIIGNGFDLAHGLCTRYCHFKKWLFHNGYKDYGAAKDFVDILESYTKDVDFWSDFELALGSIRSVKYLKYIIDDFKSEQPEDDPTAQSDAVYAAIEYIIKKQYHQLIQAFRSWARDIKTDGAEEEFLDLKDSNNYFLSFNYTDTLENIYGIPNERVMHIHGYAKDKRSEIIVGHEYDYSLDRLAIMALIDQELWADGGDTGDALIAMLNETIKDTKQIISNHYQYFKYLKTLDINKVIVVGHSYGKVDWPYFKMVMECCPNADWELRWHSCDDYSNANNMIKDLALPRASLSRTTSDPEKVCKCWEAVKPIVDYQKKLKIRSNIG